MANLVLPFGNQLRKALWEQFIVVRGASLDFSFCDWFTTLTDDIVNAYYSNTDNSLIIEFKDEQSKMWFLMRYA